MLKPIDAFSKKGPRQHCSYCKECQKILSRKHYEENKAYYVKKARKFDQVRLDDLNALITQAKDRPCADCNVKYPYYVMDFDHVRGTKIDAIARMRGRKVSRGRVLEEIAKCEVVCSNCHRRRTHERKNAPVRADFPA